MLTSLHWKKIFCLMLPCMALANISHAYDGHFYLGAEYGQSYGNLSNSNPEITYYQGYLTDAYPLNDTNTSSGVGGITGGYEFSGKGGYLPRIAIGLGIYTSPNGYQYKGQVVETATGGAADSLYDYQFQVNSTRYMAETKFTWDLANHVKPFIDAGIGLARNTASNYSETAISTDGYVSLSPFQSNTTNNFAYQVGAGLSYAFNFNGQDQGFQQERVSVGYRFVDLGQVNFGTRGTDYPYSLEMGTLRTQDVYLGYSHSF